LHQNGRAREGSNVAGGPIVNAALEGYSTVRRCGIDVLVAGSTLVTKRATSTAKSATVDVA
jgi:carbamoyltransferase